MSRAAQRAGTGKGDELRWELLPRLDRVHEDEAQSPGAEKGFCFLSWLCSGADGIFSGPPSACVPGKLVLEPCHS